MGRMNQPHESREQRPASEVQSPDPMVGVRSPDVTSAPHPCKLPHLGLPWLPAAMRDSVPVVSGTEAEDMAKRIVRPGHRRSAVTSAKKFLEIHGP